MSYENLVSIFPESNIKESIIENQKLIGITH